MPVVPFDTLPDDARIWIFGSTAPVHGAGATRLLSTVSEFIEEWHAHGEPLLAGRELRDQRFLVIGVDQRTAGASGCSIDGLFRALRALEPAIGASLLGGGRVYYRAADGEVHSAERHDLAELAAKGIIGPHTPVFDTTLTRLADFRERFETEASKSWHAELLAV